MSLNTLNLNTKLGAVFLGGMAAGILYGITCLQSFIYFKRNQSDTTPLQIMIGLLWFLDSVHTALVTHSLYSYLITNYMNPKSLLAPNWSILSQVYITCIADLIIRGIYGQRVWKVSRNVIVVVAITLTSLLTCTAGFAYACIAFVKEKTFADLQHISFLMYIALGSAVVADILIAASMCITLSRSRTGFKRTDSVVTMLMLYTINSSLLTTVCSIACFLTYTIWPMEFTFIGIYVCLTKLFFNSLLALLNGRESMKTLTVGHTTGSLEFSNSSLKPQTSISMDAYNDPTINEYKESIRLRDTTQHVAVRVDRQALTTPRI